MTTSRPSRASTSGRRADEQKVREALAALSQTDRLEALRNVPLSRSVIARQRQPDRSLPG